MDETTERAETRTGAASQRERIVWLLVFSIPPGIGMMGFVAVALQRGGLTPTAIATGCATTIIIAGFLGFVFFDSDSDSDSEPPTEPTSEP